MLGVVLFVLYVGKNINMPKELLYEVNISDNNISICEEMLKIIKNGHTKVEYNKDEKSNLSYYNHIKDAIILKVNNSGSSRIVQIAHECIHTIQNKRFLKANKFFPDLQIIYFLISLIYISLNRANPLLLVSVQILILLGTLFVKVVIEGDASYRSIELAKKYLAGKVKKEEVELYITEAGGYIYELMPIYYINFFAQGMTMVMVNIVVALIT